ncbi:MAG: Fic family protein [Marinomonas sp.]|uniref:Fic/DOC family protein n=1 Tax=Marinomonas sp. TaxID=1904862 RepID=UPI003C7268DE
MVDKYGVGQDPYTYPNSNTLVNKLHIKDEKQLCELENQLSTLALADIDFTPAPYSFSHLCSLHKALFGELYNWAGEPRSIAISKLDTRFCQPEFIEREADKLFSQMQKKSFFEELDFGCLCTEMAELYIELNMVHPFREGNGRAQRLLFEHLAIHCGYNLSFEAISKEQWIEANIIGCLNCDYSPMKDIFIRSLSSLE